MAKAKRTAKAGPRKKAANENGRVEHTIKLATKADVEQLDKKLARIKEAKAEVRDDAADAWKNHKKSNIHKKAFTAASKLAEMKDADLATYWAHFQYYVSDVVIGHKSETIEERATKQLTLWKDAVEVSKVNQAKVPSDLAEIKRKQDEGEHVTQAEREKLADFEVAQTQH